MKQTRLLIMAGLMSLLVTNGTSLAFDQPAQAREAARRLLETLANNHARLEPSAEMQVAADLHTVIRHQAAGLGAVTPLSFHGRSDISASFAAGLMEEQKTLAATYAETLRELTLLKQKRDRLSVLGWLVVARNLSMSRGEADDFLDAKLIEDDMSMLLAIANTGLFNSIIFPSVAELVGDE